MNQIFLNLILDQHVKIAIFRNPAGGNNENVLQNLFAVTCRTNSF